MLIRGARNTLRLFPLVANLTRNVSLYKNQFRDSGLEDLLRAHDLTDEEVSQAKVLTTGATAVICQPYADVIGKKLTYSERQALLLIGALARVYDDLFDEEDLPREVLEGVLDADGPSVSNSRLDLFFHLYADLKVRIGSNLLFYDILPKLHEAQCKSNEQLGDISPERMLEISEQKGGYSVLLFYSAINPEMTEQEQEAFYYGGAWIQLADDLLDAKYDLRDGIHTLASDKTALLNAIEKNRTKAFEIGDKLPYDEKRKELFFYRGFASYLAGMGLVEFINSSRKVSEFLDSFKIPAATFLSYTKEVSLQTHQLFEGPSVTTGL